MSEYFRALAGGALIGLSALLLLRLNGKILGVSGIAGGLFRPGRQDKRWRFGFLVGLFSGGLILTLFFADAISFSLSRSYSALIAAGLLVGYGTRLGGGCTSGHGICGVSRLSPRSLAATFIFIACGAATVFVINHLAGGRL